MRLEIQEEELEQINKPQNLEIPTSHIDISDGLDSLEFKLIQNELESAVDKHIDTLQEWQDLLQEIFPDLETSEISDCYNEIKKLRITYGFNLDTNYIKALLLYIKNLNSHKDKTTKQENLRTKLQKTMIQIMQKQTLTSKNTEDGLQNTEFAALMYMIQSLETLPIDDQKKLQKKLTDRIKELQQKYTQGYFIEIYEVQLKKDGKIVIQWNLQSNHASITYDPNIKQPTSPFSTYKEKELPIQEQQKAKTRKQESSIKEH